MSKLLPLLFILGCDSSESTTFHGTPYTTELGFRVWGELGNIEDIDKAFAVWAGLHPERDPEELLAIAKAYPILGARNNGSGAICGRTVYGSHIWIDIEMCGWTDFYMHRENKGGWYILEHEWEHVLRGSFH